MSAVTINKTKPRFPFGLVVISIASGDLWRQDEEKKICHKKKRAEISDLGEGNVEFQQSKVWISALMLTDVKIIGMEVVNCTWEVVSRASIKHTDASLW